MQNSTTTNNATENPSAKVRPETHALAGKHADELGTNRLEIFHAWGEVFDALPKEQKRSAIRRIRRRHPLPFPRKGRGNRKSAA